MEKGRAGPEEPPHSLGGSDGDTRNFSDRVDKEVG